MSAVHPGDDGGGEDVPLAVHRVQVLQHVRHVGERRMLGLLSSHAHVGYGFYSNGLSPCVLGRSG